MSSFCVIKRNGVSEEVSFDKVIRRIKKLCNGLSPELNPIIVAQKVCSQIYNNVSTVELDELAAQMCISMETINLDYGVLASRIIISNNHKCTSPSFSETIYLLYNNKDRNNNKCPLIADDVYQIIMKHKDKLNASINYEKDYLFDYFGFKTLEKAYLMRVNNKIIERVQHLFMRVSIGIHKEDLKSVIESYELMSSKYFTHATPSLYNAGTIKPQFSSCFLLGMDDSVKGIYKGISDCAEISACSGGIGISISKIRSKNSYIKGSNGYANGIIPLCRVLNETARHINQGGKRPGSIAVYIEPHNVEILEFLELKKNTGAESERARDLFLALWISDLFMKRVEEDLDWSLFDSNESSGLESVYGENFEKLYEKYENEGHAKKVIKARKIWNYI
jgi:ribonucleoside-diphosphate reductase alpha chain